MNARLLTALVALSVPVCACAQLEDQPNLCPNPGFEEVDDAGWAEGWEIWPPTRAAGASVIIDDQVAHSGTHSLRLHHESTVPYSRAQRRIEVTPGASYLFTCFVRTEDVQLGDGSQGARLYIEKPTGDRASSLQQGTMPWTQIRVGPIEVGTASAITLMCYLHQASGTVWFDDIRMIEVTEAVAQSLAQQRVQESFASQVTLARTLAVEADDQEALARLGELQETAWATELPTEIDHRAGPPWFPLHAELFRVAAQVNARRLPGAGPMAVWADDPFAPFSPMELIPEERDAAEVVMCGDERDQALIKLCALGDAPVTVEVAIAAPEEPGAPGITPREVICIDPGGGQRMYGDPLPLLDMSDGRATMTLAPGVVRGLWLQIDSVGATPGSYRATVTITPTGGAAIEREVRVRVLPVTMPADKPIVTWNYSYEHYWIMPERWEQARRGLVAHHINAYCWPASYLPFPQLDENGAMLPLDWSAFDAGLRTHDSIAWLLLWPGFDWPDRQRLLIEGLEFGSGEWRRVFTEWFTALRVGLDERGFGPDRVAWYIADEPITEPKATVVGTTGELILEIAPDALTLANPYPRVNWPSLRIMDPGINLWCPMLSLFDEEHTDFFRAGSEVLWSYQVLPKWADPFGSYRFSFWRCHELGVTGQGFWCYADAQGSNWDPWDHERAEYAPVYDGDERELIPGRRWEAWREGVEDYTLLWMLDRAAEGDLTADQRRAVDEARAATAAALTEGTPAAVSRARVLAALAAFGG